MYYRQDTTVLQAKCDEYGNRISESYLLKDSEKITQANKLNVVPDENNNEYHTFSFKINNTSYAFPPVSILKLDTSADDISQSKFTFDNSDATSFYYEPELDDNDPFKSIIFDSKMHLRKTYDLEFTTPENFRHGFISWSNIIPLNRFRTKYSITVNSHYDDIANTNTPESSKLFLSGNKLYTATGMLLTENWDIATDTARENYFLQYKNTYTEFTAVRLLTELGLENIQVLVYNTEPNIHHTGKFNGLPNKQLVIPKGLIPTAKFTSILNVDMSYQLVNNSNIKVAVSPNLDDWYTYKTNLREWQPLTVEYNDYIQKYIPTLYEMEEKGIGIHMIQSIGNWMPFTTNIAFCYLLNDENMKSHASVTEVEFTATMKGSWKYYPHLDYYYANDNLNVKIFDAGSYKINYKRF